MQTSNRPHFVNSLGLLVLILSVTTQTATATEESWGNTVGFTEPQPDTKGRAGYWWWPRTVGGDEDTSTASGNRGRVYGAWDKPGPMEIATPETPPPPPAPQPPICKCAVILNNVLFDFDDATLKPVGRVEIDKLVAEMNKFKKDTVVCIGHTDNVGSEAYNRTLGLRRAQAVKDYVVAQGIAEERVGVKSMGETQPAVPNDSRMNRALNRRVEFKITIVN